MSDARLFDVGEAVRYKRNATGETVEAVVGEVYDLDEAGVAERFWPKPRHCRYVYRVGGTGLGPRTLCQCRLSLVKETSW